MTASDLTAAYLHLAGDLYGGQITEIELPAATTDLPTLHKNLLDELAQYAEGFSTTKPRYGWAIARAAQQAAISQTGDLFLQSLAAWYLARACNHWAQPKRVKEAVATARRGFAELNERGWLAACDWQENALAWTQPNFREAAQALKEALAGLEQSELTEFVPECRLSLAYAQILIGDHTEAMNNIRLSEELYTARGDQVNQARGWLHQASSLRRRDRFEEASQKLQQALAVFERENAVTDQGRVRFQLGLLHLLKVDDLPRAIDQFTKAAELFRSTEVDLWQGTCISNLGSVYLFTGELALADRYYQQTEEIFLQHEIPGLLADNLNDHGEVNLLLGRMQPAIEQFKRSIALNERLGSHLSAAIVTTNLGKAYGQSGRYQDALAYLEHAAEGLEALESYFRLGICERYMAFLWSRLGQYQTAHRYLDQAAAHFEKTGQKNLLAGIYTYRAFTYFRQGLREQGIKALEQSLHIAETVGIRPQSALAKHLLGGALLQTARKEEAWSYLQSARADFMEMGMTLELADCLISVGSYHLSHTQPDDARSAFEQALQLSAKSFPEIDWRANLELGNLAQSQGYLVPAIDFYRLGMEAFGQVRHNFLQPALAGSYAQTPTRAFDRIISVTSQANSARDALQFMEELKASTLLRSLAEDSPMLSDSTTQELDNLKAEIDALRDQLRTSFEETHSLHTALSLHKVRERLKTKITQYDELKASLERKSFSNRSAALLPNAFELDHFRAKAASALSTKWIALEYYLAESELITVMVDPQNCRVISRPVSHRFRMALDACDQARRNARPPLNSDLDILGTYLLPASLTADLTPDTVLLIAPHRRLHQVPWSALRAESTDQPLVCLCIPCIVPSLQSLTLLWKRRETIQSGDRRQGLIVGLSSFQNRYEELPQVREELKALRSAAGVNVQVLAEEQASWENLVGCRNEDDWTQLAWLHLATHFSSDRHTGRLSSIALSDGDIWLDQLRDLAPLPELVSLSACNSNDTFLYEGDERVDLQTTCLIAGAQSVIGSSWPLQDQSAAELMLLFYHHYLSGLSPACAVAHAQRRFIEDGKELQTWASFLCVGVP